MNQHACVARMSTQRRLLLNPLPLFSSWVGLETSVSFTHVECEPRDHDLVATSLDVEDECLTVWCC